MPKQTIKKNELIILLCSLLAFAVLLTLTTIYYRSGDKQDKSDKEEPVVVEGVIASKNQSETEKPPKQSETIGSAAFFLTPTAAEVLSALREADPYTEQPDLQNGPPMKVMWPGYFFPDQELIENNDKITIQLDIDENGFGVILVCTVSVTDYPEVKTLKPGQQIWVAGEVTEIDMDGTGAIAINVEYIRFDEGPLTTRNSVP